MIGERRVEVIVDIHTCRNGSGLIRRAWSDNALIDVEVVKHALSPENPARIRIEVSAMPKGRFRAHVWVETDLPESPRLKIPVFGESVRGLSCDHGLIDFESFRRGEPRPLIVNLSHEPFVAIGGVRPSNDAVSVRQINRSEDGLRITLAASWRLPLGIFDGYLILEANCGGKARKIKLPYRGRVIPADATAQSRPSTDSDAATDSNR